ncbi:MAG TPA: tetratricopeptide repeat protein [Deltaproteobacteria bacterium]|nr:tetratricopeptide repeat protein [Deltaproteobacteria bacterium]
MKLRLFIFLICFFLGSVPAGAEDWYQQGFELLKAHQFEAAAKAFDSAIKENPRDAKAYNQRGVALANMGHLDQAVASYTKALEIDSNLYGAVNNRGSAFYRKGDYDLAISDFSRAIELNPYLEVTYSNRGIVWIKKGQMKRAISDFDKAVEINPYSYEAHYNRGTAHASNGSWGLSIKDFSKALDLNPKSYGAYDRLARILASCPDGSYRNGEQAVKYAKKAMEINPDNRHLDTLAMALAEVGRFEDAVYVMERVVSTLADQKDVEDIQDYKSRLNTYKDGKPWREKSVESEQPRRSAVKTEQPQKQIAKTERPQKQVAGTQQPQKQVAEKTTFTIQVGAFLERENAVKRMALLTRKEYDARLVVLTDAKGRVWHLVRIGSYDSEASAKAAAQTFSKKEKIKVSVRPGGKL